MGRQKMKEFEINFVQLDNGVHEFDFQVDQDFFGLFEEGLVERGKGDVFLELEKSETMLQLHFHIKVEVELFCDITVEPYQFQITSDPKLILKFGETDEELSEDIMVIDRGRASINVAHFIHEFISLGVPIKKIHPDIADQERPDLVYSDKNIESQEEQTDPRWEALKKLKNKN